MIKEHLHLTQSEREELEQLVARHNVALKVWRRAVGLLALDEGATLQEAARRAGVTYNSVSAWCARYQEQGLHMLQDAPRSGRPTTFDGLQRAQITALACSTPPEGHARWSLSLLAEKAVELGLVPSISHDSVHGMLKKHAPAAPEEDVVHPAHSMGASSPTWSASCGCMRFLMIHSIPLCVLMNGPAS